MSSNCVVNFIKKHIFISTKYQNTKKPFQIGMAFFETISY